MTRPEVRLARLLVRRHRGMLGRWIALLVALTGATTSAYQRTYTTAEQRRAATEVFQHNAASTVLYGALGGAEPADMFVWEIGAFVTILAAIMAVLTAVALTRVGEDDGTVELLRGSGAPATAPLRAALLALAGVGGVLAIGCAGAVGLWAGRVDAVTWPGAVVFGAVVGATFVVTAVLAVALAQVAPTATGARTLGLAVLGVAFLARAVADLQDLPWLNWLSVLGLRATVRPFHGDRAWIVLVALAVAGCLAVLALWLSGRREHGAGLVAEREPRTPRRALRSGLALTARLVRRPATRWTAGVAVLGTAFAAMGSGAVEQARRAELSGFLAYIGTLIAIATCVFAALSMLAVPHEERDGVTDLVLSTGTRRWAPLAWRVGVTSVASMALLLVTGALSAAVVPVSLDGADVALRAFWFAAGQWPAVVALTGWAALVAGLWPRRSWLVWIPLLVSAVLVLLGELLGLGPDVRELGLFGHVPDAAGADLRLAPLALLAALGLAGAAVGAWGTTRRDVASS